MPFKILSLDGGGIRGAFTASFLATVAANLANPIGKYFDLIAGTSTGGIIGTAIALDYEPDRIMQFYRKWGPEIFPNIARKQNLRSRFLRSIAKRFASRLGAPHSLDNVQLNWLVQPRYDTRVLERALNDVFANAILNDAKHRLIVPAVDLIKGQTVTYKTPHIPGMIRDKWLPAAKICLATSAAPIYFQPASILDGSLYADGGLWANNPSIVAFTEAIRISRECQRPVDPRFSTDEICLLSIGTGTLPYYANPAPGSAGIAYWGVQLFDIVSAAQSQGVDFEARFLVPGERYLRVDFRLPDPSWTLDNSERLDQLIHRGRECAAEYWSRMRDIFFDSVAPEFVPFES